MIRVRFGRDSAPIRCDSSAIRLQNTRFSFKNMTRSMRVGRGKLPLYNIKKGKAIERGCGTGSRIVLAQSIHPAVGSLAWVLRRVWSGQGDTFKRRKNWTVDGQNSAPLFEPPLNPEI